MTGFWKSSIHSDVAFWFFDVCSSYHCVAGVAKCMFTYSQRMWAGFRPPWDGLIFTLLMHLLSRQQSNLVREELLVRMFSNAIGWTANVAKLLSVGLWLNAFKSESMLTGMITPLTTVTWVAIASCQHHPLAVLHLKSVCMPQNNFQWWSSQTLCRQLS